MADKKITDLDLHTSLQLSDTIAIVNSNETKKTTYGSLYYGIRDNVVSGSSQIDITQTQNYGNVMVTGSLNGSSLTFEKGDSSTFDIELGTEFVQVSYISCYSTGSQPLVSSGSEQVVTLDSVWTENGISLVDNTKITFEEAAAYEFKFVAQVTNFDNDVHNTYFWIKYNGNNFPNSTTIVSLNPRKDSDNPSSQLLSIAITGIAQNDGDYIELFWTADNTLISLTATPGNGIVPSSPSVIASVIRV